jgi:hypothetical protein
MDWMSVDCLRCLWNSFLKFSQSVSGFVVVFYLQFVDYDRHGCVACLLAGWMMQIRLALETKNGSGTFLVLATRSILMALGPTVQH